MKKILFATFMGALVALAGCQQNDELTGVENTLGKKVSVTANIKANAQSRVAMEYVTGADGGSTIKVDWKASGESFKMYDAADETKVKTFDQTSENQFVGELPSESGSYYAEYGSIANLTTQDGTLNEDYVWMKSDVITDLTQPIQFEHQTTILMPTFTFESEPIKASITKIVIPGDAQAITITPSQGDNTITPSQVDDIFIFLPVMNGEAIEAGTNFNFIVTWGDEEYIGTLTISKDMERGKFYTANIDLEEVIPYVTFTADATQTFKYGGSDLEYSLDGVNFVALTSTDEIEFGEDGKYKLYLRNKGEENLDGTVYNNGGSQTRYKIVFGNDAVPVACTGDIRTLIDFKNYKTVDTSEAQFIGLFSLCTELTSAPALPATKLAEACYQEMFAGCTNLVKAPDLPATELSEACYYQMFNGCKKLTSAPELPATTLADYCYTAMFASCTSLETAPALPAETLAQSCYYEMFSGCTKLSNITMLATDISADNCLTDWVKGVAATGEFTKASTMTSLLTGDSGIPAGWSVNP